jgi:hypothetical protein
MPALMAAAYVLATRSNVSREFPEPTLKTPVSACFRWPALMHPGR